MPGCGDTPLGAITSGGVRMLCQLRGVRLMDALLSHPAVQRRMGG